MSPHKKLVSHIIWIFFAFLLGIGISYFVLEGGKLALATVQNKTQGLEKGEKIIPQYTTVVPVNSPISSEEIIDSVTTFTKSPDSSEKEEIISIGFVGDIIPGANASLNIFSEIVAYTERPDIMIGNFEGVATNNTYSKCKPDSKNCFSFNGNSNFVKLLSDASFDVLNVANNHFNDHGQIGQEETLREIGEAGMVASGIKDDVIYIKRKDLKIAIVGFSNYSWTSDLNNTRKVKELIGTADQNSDIVVVIFHAGGEGEKYSHTLNETEWYLNENRGNVYSFAHNAVDAGADIVLGSGPHILRGIEKYNGKIIAYSLGNFASANTISTYGMLKTSAMLEVTLDKNGSLVSGTIFPFEINRNGTPHPDLNNSAISIINELSKSDFGEQGVVLIPDGKIQIE